MKDYKPSKGWQILLTDGPGAHTWVRTLTKTPADIPDFELKGWRDGRYILKPVTAGKAGLQQRVQHKDGQYPDWRYEWIPNP